jgi:hypothetical protein
MEIDTLSVGIRLIIQQLRPLKGGGVAWMVSGDVRERGRE